jgi:hypothetical protein
MIDGPHVASGLSGRRVSEDVFMLSGYGFPSSRARYRIMFASLLNRDYYESHHVSRLFSLVPLPAFPVTRVPALFSPASLRKPGARARAFRPVAFGQTRGVAGTTLCLCTPARAESAHVVFPPASYQ